MHNCSCNLFLTKCHLGKIIKCLCGIFVLQMTFKFRQVGIRRLALEIVSDSLSGVDRTKSAASYLQGVAGDWQQQSSLISSIWTKEMRLQRQLPKIELNLFWFKAGSHCAATCNSQLHFCTEIEIFLSLCCCSLLRFCSNLWLVWTNKALLI